MNKNKIISATIIAIAITMTSIGIVMLVNQNTNSKQKNNIAEIKEKDHKVVYNALEYTNHRIIQENGKITFQVTLKNLGTSPVIEHKVKIAFYTDNNKKLGDIEHTIPQVENELTITLDYFDNEIPDNYTIKVSETIETSLTG